MNLKNKEQTFWNSYLSTLNGDFDFSDCLIEAGIAGNKEIANELLNLYLEGKKTAGSGLVKDYELSNDPLPKVGNHWIILDSKETPKCIVKTVRVEFNRFDQIPEEVAKVEGEGDLSLEYWYEGHRNFFQPFLSEWGIDDLDKEMVVTEFYEVVYTLNQNIKSIESYQTPFTNPLKLKLNDEIELIAKNVPDKWKGWNYCKSQDGNEGWISETYFKRVSEGKGIIIKDYDATELSINENETVQVIYDDCGWAWCKKISGEEGWLPLENLGKSHE